ncbi:uncharacterized protein LOC117794119 [Drosophila innubila]|uniref:uncharacterized protein LOC117794119 n=1 Tax=Drosophila innubila TaxID=198719 RepID=UPI00148D5D4A|nr:uncharacterized protein LOC117794119 [Drosophila innubila]
MIAKRLPERFGQYEKRTIPRISTLIDARFKKYGFLHTFNADEAAKALEDELSDCLSLKTSQKPPTPSEPKRTRFEFLKYYIAAKLASNRADSIIMLNQYLTKPNAEEDVDPLIYWKNSDEEALKLIAKKYMCVPATSCASERMFSKAGQVVSDSRCALKPQIVNALLFINQNYDLLNT